MKNIIKCGHCLFVALTILAGVDRVAAQGTKFSYQGNLNTNGAPANGYFDFEFSLYSNAEGSGAKIGSTITETDIGVTNGLFSVALDFGDIFTGNDLWLAMSVRSNGVGSYTALSPLQELTPTPYAIFATTASNLSGTLPAAQISGVIPLAQLPGAVVTNNETTVGFANLTLSSNLTLPSQANITSGGNSLLRADGDDNFYAGPGAGPSSNSGSANTGIGVGTLQTNINGTNNTAIGYEALGSNTNGSYNTAAGERALLNNASGNDNTADGRHALESNTSGNDNTAGGYEALLSNKSGNQNTAVGATALSGNPGGSNNIALGYGAGSAYGAGESSNIDIGNVGVAKDSSIIRIGTGQTSTFIAGVINGNGGGLTNLNAVHLSGDISLALLPSAVVTNEEGGVTLDNVTVGGTLTLGDPATIYAGNSSLVHVDLKGNFFAGPSAGNLATTGSRNTALGSGALLFDTSGYDNTACGGDALFNNGAGSFNTAYGAAALEANVTGSNNTAVGVGALSENTSGSNNTANGLGALTSNTTGRDNTAVGLYAMGGVSPGTSGANTATGGYAIYDITTGYNNTAEGYQALQADSTGFDNVGIGVATFQANSGGFQNTGVGTYAFQQMTSGTGNIGLGIYAGYDLFNGTNNIYIGNYGVSAENNVIRIGQGQGETYLAGTVNCGPIISGAHTCCTMTITGGCDLAEPFPISTAEQQVVEGAVVVIDAENEGHLKLADRPYDTRVAGVVSGANGINPGIQMQQQGLLEGGRNVALTGRVYVQADTSNGPIEPGDLLTTSSTPGRAMKVTDHVRAQGAILGKAMSGLKEGNGMVLVLVTLQ
ncbi:MAG TPA: hypothetical protein VMR33_18895 [Candidatus Baltobacteraceae bacterium]|jgi:hypothetical protein|nr:hypothetical protein [Candidatus Baltobacteraceae bacterium]